MVESFPKSTSLVDTLLRVPSARPKDLVGLTGGHDLGLENTQAEATQQQAFDSL